MIRVLITGGAGYIGCELVKMLANSGKYEILVIDNLMYNSYGLLGSMNKNVKFIYGDVRNYKLIEEHVKWADVIIPLAALVGMPVCERNYQAAMDINTYQLDDIVANMKKDTLIIYPNTNSGYGIGLDSNFCTEETKLTPISTYGKTKCFAENTVLHQANGIAFRLATVFGSSARMRTDLLVNNFVYKAMTDGYIVLFESHFKRNYVHIKDVCRAFLFMIENCDKYRGEVFNLGLSSANLSKLELANKVKEYIPKFTILESNIGEDPDKRNYIVSNEKIESTGFSFLYSLDDGIMELMNAYEMIIPLSMTFRNY